MSGDAPQTTEGTEPNALVTPAGWQALRRYTAARIAIGRAGHSQPTAAHLAFQAAHAAARDAVHLPLNAPALASELSADGWDVLRLRSRAPDRLAYLQRPDWGRRLNADDAARLSNPRRAPADIAFVVADGLSALAIHRNAVPLLRAVRQRLHADAPAWTFAPVCIVEQGRVAVGDEVGELLGATLVVVLIGERPGLSSPDSLGLYFTWGPRVGRTDAERNCISNVRQEGLGVSEAAAKLGHLLGEARRRQLTGVALKDETEPPPATLSSRAMFLLGD